MIIHEVIHTGMYIHTVQENVAMAEQLQLIEQKIATAEAERQ